ncbi:MAG: hypothetical protein Fur0022_40070 [Anaerolineales bacterium]
MNTKTYRLFIPLLILILASLACATISGGPQNLPTVTVPTITVPTIEVPSIEIPTVTAPDIEPTPAEGETSGGGTTAGTDTLNLDDPAFYAAPANINTYRTSLVFSFSGTAPDGTPISGSLTGEGAFSVNPPQASFTFQSSGADVALGNMEIIQLDNTIYMTSPDLGCFSLPVGANEAENPYEEFLDLGGFLTGQATRVQPDETINGIPVYVYEITSANLDVNDPTTQQVSEITFGRIYIAQEGGYVVRLLIDGRGQNTLLTEGNDVIGDVHYELTYYDQNQPVNIVAPANCAGEPESGGGVVSGSFPIPEGVTDLAAIPGITTFSSAQTVEELTTFYKTEMVVAGWTAGEEITLPGLVTLTFTKDGKTATITITADPATGKTQVAIFEG